MTDFEEAPELAPHIIALWPARDIRRAVDHVFSHPEGLVWADVGWNDPAGCPFHPFHLAAGKIVRDGDCWRIGAATLRPVRESDSPCFDPFVASFPAWRVSPDGGPASRALCEQVIRDSGLFW